MVDQATTFGTYVRRVNEIMSKDVYFFGLALFLIWLVCIIDQATTFEIHVRCVNKYMSEFLWLNCCLDLLWLLSWNIRPTLFAYAWYGWMSLHLRLRNCLVSLLVVCMENLASSFGICMKEWSRYYLVLLCFNVTMIESCLVFLWLIYMARSGNAFDIHFD